MQRNSENSANEQIGNLKLLSELLDDKKRSVNNSHQIKVIAFVGAGPSRAAGLPLSDDLKKSIYENFVGDKQNAHEIFKLEYESYQRSNSDEFDLNKITLFELAAIISRFAYGRKIIKDTIDSELSKATHRPLSYELLSHFVKHKYIDHFIILNYDRLLCEALRDELNKSDLKIIRSAADIPYNDDINSNVCYAIYPFGILGEASNYSMTTDDVKDFGSKPIRDFIKHKIFDVKSKNSEMINILMIGYRGFEPAFDQLMHMIASKNRKEQINVFVINPTENATKHLAVFQSDDFVVNNIKLDADLAFELVFELLKDLWGEKNLHSWVSAARHRILSKLFDCANMRKKDRFVIELLLQGLKSRGFVHLETFGKVPRLKKYSNNNSAQAIKELIAEKILIADEWLVQNTTDTEKKNYDYYVPNYTIETENAINKLLGLIRSKNLDIFEWCYEAKKKLFKQHQCNPDIFLRKEIDRIQKAPDIEIVKDVEPEVKWVLGYDGVQVEELLTIDALKTKTHKIFNEKINNNLNIKDVIIRGIWSTGEWLFWDDAWASELGSNLLTKENVTLKILITRSGGVKIERAIRREYVIERLQKHIQSEKGAKIEMRWTNWWEMNRILTIVSYDGSDSAIHMRRRLNNPLVCPYYIPPEATIALKYLHELWNLYWSRAEKILMP